MPLSPIRSRSRSLLVLALPLLCSSCFTMWLWGFAPEDEVDPFTGEGETTFVYDPDTEWSWGSFFVRVLGTPLTLALDCVTCPVQAACCCDDDEREHPCGGR